MNHIFLLIVFQVVILGIFTFILKLILKPSDPGTQVVNLDYCNKKMRELEDRICNQMEDLKTNIVQINNKLDNIILKIVEKSSE